jgi:hypothetical protein
MRALRIRRRFIFLSQLIEIRGSIAISLVATFEFLLDG